MTETNNNERNSKEFEKDGTEEFRKMWDNLGTSKEDFANVNKKLEELNKTFSEAVKNGAEPEVLKKIAGDWQLEKMKLDAMKQQLNLNSDERNRPDAMRDYVNNMYSELGKGVHIVNEKSKDFIEQKKKGLIASGKELTNKIKAVNDKVKSIFKEKQQNLARNFSKALEQAKGKISDKSLDAMVKAAKAAEAFDRKNAMSKETLDSRIKATLEKQNKALDVNNERTVKRFKKIENERISRTSRIKAGFETMKDAVQGKEYTEHKPEEKSVSELGREYQKAMAKATRGSKNIEMASSLKINALKSWAKLEQGIANVGAKISRGISKGIEKSINERGSEDLKERAADLNKDLAKAKEQAQEKEVIKNNEPKKSNSNRDDMDR